jgi:hypothetical protein
MAFPPAADATQTGYFLPGRGDGLLIADIEGQLDSSAPVTLNGDPGLRVPGVGETYLIGNSVNPQSAEVLLGSGSAPLVIRKEFNLAPVPDPESALPRIDPVNPNAQGQVQLENDSQYRLSVALGGDASLTNRLTVRAVVFRTDSGEPVFGPEALPASNGRFESNALVDIEAGIEYRAIVWMDATRARDQLRYGDAFEIRFRAEGGIIHSTPNLTLQAFPSAVDIIVDVTEANRQADLTPKLIWDEQPDGVDASALFSVQLAENLFEGLGNRTTLRLTGPDDLCDLPEGVYEGRIEFVTSSGLPVIPPEVEVIGRSVYGNIAVAETESVDLGLFCRMPGMLQALCHPLFGNEETQTARIDLEVPACISSRNIEVELENIIPSDETRLGPGELKRTRQDGSSAAMNGRDPASLQIIPEDVAPINPVADFARQVDYTGNLAIGRADDHTTRGLAQVHYTKMSLIDVITPWWPFLGRQARVGNLVGLIVAVTLFFGTTRFLFGSRDDVYDDDETPRYEGRKRADRGNVSQNNQRRKPGNRLRDRRR